MAAGERDRAVELGRAAERLDLLFMRALSAGDRAEARAVVHESVELLGLQAPRRAELSGPGGAPLGGTLAERAQQFLADFDRLAARQHAIAAADDHKGGSDV